LNVLRKPETERHGFECVKPGKACKLYFDIEWYGPYDPKREYLLQCMEAIRAHLTLVYGSVIFELYVTCGSRDVSPGIFKNSFHIVVGNVVFSSNHEGAMKRCVAAIKASLGETTKHGIDMTVYSRGQMMRTILCGKRESNVPLRSITGDACSSTSTCFSNDNLMQYNCNGLENYLITVLQDYGTIVRVDGVGTMDRGDGAAKKAASRKCELTIRSVTSAVLEGDGDFMPLLVTSDYQQMLDATSSRCCVVTGKIIEIGGVYILQCRNSGVRTCIANTGGRLHENENARLVVAHGYVEYRCFSDHCNNSSNHHVLGAVPESFDVFIGKRVGGPGIDVDGLCEGSVESTETTGEKASCHVKTVHKQLLPFPGLTVENKLRMTLIEEQFLDKS